MGLNFLQQGLWWFFTTQKDKIIVPFLVFSTKNGILFFFYKNLHRCNIKPY